MIYLEFGVTCIPFHGELRKKGRTCRELIHWGANSLIFLMTIYPFLALGSESHIVCLLLVGKSESISEGPHFTNIIIK